MYAKLHKLLKLSHHRHSYKRLPRQHTSYGVLVFLMIATGLVLVSVADVAQADTETGQVNLNGTVMGAPPQDKAVILQPSDNQTTNTSSVTVSGTCSEYVTVVQVFRNDIFAGSTVCTGETFTLSITLYAGSNVLIAKSADNFGQFAPDSDPVTVTYTPLVPPKTSTGSGGRQSTTKNPGKAVPPLLLTSDQPYMGAKSGQSFELSLVVSGGYAPYALIIQWGDGDQDVLTQAAAGATKMKHVYKSGGLYKLNVQAVDNRGNKATLQALVIVSGPVTVGTSPIKPSGTPDLPYYVKPSFAIIWPLYLFLLALLLAFWLGERYELHKLKVSHRLIS